MTKYIILKSKRIILILPIILLFIIAPHFPWPGIDKELMTIDKLKIDVGTKFKGIN